MSVRHFGIYLAYGPRVDLRKEGLGRLLGAFLNAAATRDDVRFVVVCPHWSRKSLLAWCGTEGIPAAAFDVVSTDGVPLALRVYLALKERRRAVRKASPWLKLAVRVQAAAARHRRRVERRLATTRSVLLWLAAGLYVFALTAGLLPLVVLVGLVWLGYAGLRGVARRAAALLTGIVERVITGITEPDEESVEVRLYRLMGDAEAERMLAKIRTLTHVQAWYCPTAFWPAFNRIAAPRLMCVPDVLPAEFPVGFARLEPELVKTFEIVERAIHGGQHFVTYSGRIKWNSLVQRYGVNPGAVTVIPHATWDLSAGLQTRAQCESLLEQAARRSGAPAYAAGLLNGSTRFLFYPSQFRPNKNLPALLRAYEYLLRERFIASKLLLTGDPHRYPEVKTFIEKRGLQDDVICLHGLTAPELAACYSLADLAVNPSLSEGGCPFTLTEALSVNTPVVMADIEVTGEVIVDPQLRKMMLFDPFDWRDAAAKIEWALEHREALLAAQTRLYTQLRERSWRDVVDDYVAVLDELSGTQVKERFG